MITLACLVFAFLLASSGDDGWGWFIFLALLFGGK